jgi:DNA-binding NarL/FixJ family response regulator
VGDKLPIGRSDAVGVDKKIVIVEDHESYADLLANELNGKLPGRVVGSFRNVPDAISAIGELEPDLVCLDLQLGTDDGLQVFTSLKPRLPLTRWLLLTSAEKVMVVHRAMRAGLNGIVLKQSSVRSIIEVAEKLLNGESGMCGRAFKLLSECAKETPTGKLTTAERELLTHIGKGLTVKESASLLGLSEKTAHNRLVVIREKLNLQSLVELARYAMGVGLVSPP